MGHIIKALGIFEPINLDSGGRDNEAKVWRRLLQAVLCFYRFEQAVRSIRPLSGREAWMENLIKMPVLKY